MHGCFTGDVDRAAFEESLNEASPDPIPPFMTQFDSQLGFAVRRWCAPRLGLDPHAGADEYWARRAELGSVGTARALLPAAGVSEWLVDTGFAADRLCPPDQLATWSGGSAAEVLRLESLAESLLADGVPAGGFADAFRDRLAGPPAGRGGRQDDRRLSVRIRPSTGPGRRCRRRTRGRRLGRRAARPA